MFVRDDYTLVTLNIKGGKTIDLLDNNDINIVIKDKVSVRMQSPLAHHSKPETNHCQVKEVLGFFLFYRFYFQSVEKYCQLQIKTA